MPDFAVAQEGSVSHGQAYSRDAHGWLTYVINAHNPAEGSRGKYHICISWYFHSLTSMPVNSSPKIGTISVFKQETQNEMK